MMETANEEVSQAEFARRMGVSRAAVSQWKKNDILRDDAFTKPGRTGKVIFQIAAEQVRVNRDLGQSLGNGVGTGSAAPEQSQDAPAASTPAAPDQPELLGTSQEEPAPETPAPAPPKTNTVQDQLIAARLEEQLRKNRIGAADEALRQGMLMSADDAREQMTRVAGLMMQIFEGALTDFAAAFATQFDIPQRDALHLLKNEFRNVRSTATMKQRTLADQTEREITTSVEIDA